MSQLGDFLGTLCGPADRFRTVRAVIHHRQDKSASERALAANRPAGRRRESGTEPSAPVIWTSTLRVWADGKHRARVEETRHRDGIVESSLTVVNESRWWKRDFQGHVEEGATRSRGRPGPSLTDLERHFSPALLRQCLAGLTLESLGAVRVADRECLRIRAVPRPDGHLWPHWLGFGADEYELHADPELGGVLFVGSSFRGTELETSTVTEVAFDEPLPDTLFVYEPRPGEPVRPADTLVEHLTLAAAVARAPFTVLVPTRLPEGYRDGHSESLFHPTRINGPRSHLTLLYFGPEFLSVRQSSTPDSRDDYEWEVVERNGRRVEISDPGPGAGQRVLRLEHSGTHIEIRSDLSREQLLDMAVSLEPAVTGTA